MIFNGTLTLAYTIRWETGTFGGTLLAFPHISVVPIDANVVSNPPPPLPAGSAPTLLNLGDFNAGNVVTTLLPRFFFTYSSTAGDSGSGISDANGDFEIDVAAGSDVTLQIFAHNAAVRTAAYPVVALTISTEVVVTAGPGPTLPPIALNGLAPDVETAFITAALLQDSYQHGLQEFTPWQETIPAPGRVMNNDFPVGYETTQEENKQIDALIPGAVPARPYNNPNPLGNPTIHFTSLPEAFAHEFGHALQFVRSGFWQRRRILNKFLQFLTLGTDPGQDVLDVLVLRFQNLERRRSHWFNAHTNTFIAFLEAFGMFSGAFNHVRRITAPPLSLPMPSGAAPADALHPAHHRTFFHLYRRNQPPGSPTPGGTRQPTTAAAPPPVGTAQTWPPLAAWPAGAPLEEVEGAIFSALYIDYAGRAAIGLDFVVTSYIESEATTLLEYVNWVRGRYGVYSAQYGELRDVLTRWGMLTGITLPVPGTFLRAPLSEAIAAGLSNLAIAEIATTSNPLYGDAPGGGLELTWNQGTAQPVEITPVFRGWARFIADSDSIRPVGVIDAATTNYSDWSVTGRLVIMDVGGHLKRDFLAQLPALLIPNPPDFVIYEPIKLTPEFFSTTLPGATLVEFSEGTSPPPPASSVAFDRLVSEFINGRALMQCDIGTQLHIVTDAARTLVRGALTLEYLRVTTAFRSPLVLDDFWWLVAHPNDHEGLPATGAGTGAPLVDASFTGFAPDRTALVQKFDPLHPAHTILPAWMIFAEIGAAVLADDPATHPLLTAIHAGSRTYRRIELRRWDTGAGSSGNKPFERQYPFFQVIVSPASGGTPITARVPASGIVYLALGDEPHTFRVAPRWETPPNFGGSAAAIRLSTDTAGLVIPPARDSVNVTITPTTEVVQLYTSQVDYDGSTVWDSLKSALSAGNYSASKQNRITGLAVQAADVPDALLPLDFAGTIADHYRSHRRIYGLAMESGGRHHLPPELILAVMFAAGLDARFPLTATTTVAYNPDEVLAGPDIGLYNIGDTYTALVSSGYLDAVQVPASVLVNPRTLSSGLEAGANTADIKGWEAAIEIVAATLHTGRDFLIIEYNNPPSGPAPGPCGPDSTKFHTSPPPPLVRGAPLVLAIASCLPTPSSIYVGDVAHYLGCFVDSNMRAIPWNVTDGAGKLRYPTAPDDAAFSDYENIRYQILRRLAAALALMDCGGFA
jgi:hypothetical protein